MAQIVPIYMVLNFYFIYNQEYKRYFLNPKKKKEYKRLSVSFRERKVRILFLQIITME